MIKSLIASTIMISGFSDGSVVKTKICLPIQETQETQIWYLGPEDSLEEEMATHSSIPVWQIPWTEEPSGLYGVEWVYGVAKSDMTEWLCILTHTHTHTIMTTTKVCCHEQWSKYIYKVVKANIGQLAHCVLNKNTFWNLRQNKNF